MNEINGKNTSNIATKTSPQKITDSGLKVSKDVLFITKHECGQIVKQTLQRSTANVVDYHLEKFDHDIAGYLGDYLRLKIVTENEPNKIETHYYFLKSLPLYNPKQREVVEQYGIFKKEVLLYTHLFPKIKGNSGTKKWRPNCYLSRYDLIILEELSHHGYCHTPERYQLTNRHCRQTLKTLAIMHASSLRYELNELKGQRIGDVYKDYLYETSVSEDNSWFLAGFSGIKTVALNKSKYGKGSDYEQLVESHLIEKMSQVFRIVADPSEEFQNVVVHRDLWRNNMMFLFENDENGHVDYAKPKHCILVDFQITRYLPPAVDVLLCIYLTLSKADRKKYFAEDVKFYYEMLRRELLDAQIQLEDHMSWSVFQKSLDFYKWVPLAFSGVYIPFTHAARTYITELREDKQKYHEYCNVNRDQAILAMMETDKFFADHMLTAVEEIVEYAFDIK